VALINATKTPQSKVALQEIKLLDETANLAFDNM
jgi:hypothetical protein